MKQIRSTTFALKLVNSRFRAFAELDDVDTSIRHSSTAFGIVLKGHGMITSQ